MPFPLSAARSESSLPHKSNQTLFVTCAEYNKGRPSHEMLTYKPLTNSAVQEEFNHLGRLPSLPWAQGLWGQLETRMFDRLGQGEVENVSEDTCQLIHACFEYTSW